MSIQAINSMTTLNTNNHDVIDKSGLPAATGSGSGNTGVLPSDTTGSAATDVVQLSTASKGTSTSLADIYYDVRDTNKDGLVSAQEELHYELTHPGGEMKDQVADATSTLHAVTRYSRQVSAGVSTNTIPGLVNITV